MDCVNEKYILRSLRRSWLYCVLGVLIVGVYIMDVVERGHFFRGVILFLSIVLALFCYWVLPDRVGDVLVTELHRRMVGIFVVAGIFWAMEVIPLFATSLLVISLEIILLAESGGLAGKIGGVSELPSDVHLKYSDFLSSFGSHIIVLFMGGFLLSTALTEHGIDRKIAAIFLQPFTGSPRKLIFGVLGITAFFSMWMSNTATAAMMLAIIAPVLRQLPKDDLFHRGLILSVPFGANIGGIGTPIGSPPNAIVFDALNRAGSGMEVTFLDWVMMAFPLEVLMLVVAGFMLLYFFPHDGALVLGKIESPEKIRRKGRITLVVLLFAILLWLTGNWTGLASGAVALFIAAVLAVFKIIDRDDVDSIDWHVLILMWGGLSLGVGMEMTGLTDLVTAINFEMIPLGEWGIAFVIVVCSLLFSTFMSNTATANLIVPIVMAMGVGSLATRGEFAVLVAMSCSFAMAMPVSTPPNAIAFSTGEIPVSSMIRVGGLISVVSVVVMLLGYRLFLPWVMDFGI